MSNKLLIKGGDNPPQNGDLSYKELGYANLDSGLYIGTNQVDEEGKTIPKKLNENLGMDTILNFFYPVGSFYFSTDKDFDPNNEWGGTWENITGAFLFADSIDSEEIGTKVGDLNSSFSVEIENHTLDSSNLPEHQHSINNLTGQTESSGGASVSGSVSVSGQHSHNFSGTASSTGSSHVHYGYFVDNGTNQGTAGNAQDRVVMGHWSVSNKQEGNNITTNSGSHTHSVSGSTNSVDLTLEGDLSGVSIPDHAHNFTMSGQTESAGSTNSQLSHEINVTENLPKYMAICWHRIA